MITLHHTTTSGDLPTETFTIMFGGQKVGECQLRHRPRKSDNLPDGFENHIYYEIDPEFQGKGYAKEALRLILDEARKIHLAEVILSVAETNIPSQKVMESQGAELLEKAQAKDGTWQRKYKIIL